MNTPGKEITISFLRLPARDLFAIKQFLTISTKVSFKTEQFITIRTNELFDKQLFPRDPHKRVVAGISW